MSVYCSRCGTENPDESRFCYNCGAEFAATVIPPVVEEKPADEVASEPPSAPEPEAEYPLKVEPPPVMEPTRPSVTAPVAPPYPRQEPPAPAPRAAAEVVTGESILEVAPFISRVGAFIIDFIVISLVTAIALRLTDLDQIWIPESEQDFGRLFDAYMSFVFTGKIGDMFQGVFQSFVLAGTLTLAITFFYYLIFHAVGGQTPGKFALGIKVTKRDGSNLGWGRSFFRYVVYWIGSKILYLGSFWALFNREVATWHDLASDSRVYKVSSLNAWDDWKTAQEEQAGEDLAKPLL